MYRINSISEYHKLAGLPQAEHPLVSLIDYSQVNYPDDQLSILQGNYSIALKRGVEGKVRYGQQEYDFNEGLMSFVSPGQLLNITVNRNAKPKPSGWILIINPDFLWGSTLAQKIKEYEFFGYNVNEALFLSPKEEASMIEIMKSIQKEYHSNIDAFSQNIILSQIELLLNFAERYYQRQFITRKINNHELLSKMERWLYDYFNDPELSERGLPNVQQIADELNLSANYLSSLLRNLTGLNAQQHIHQKLVEKAKEKLSTTSQSISEIAFELGFEHSQSFSRLFKDKTQLSPKEFRAAFN